jgi:hypothetical protein
MRPGRDINNHHLMPSLKKEQSYTPTLSLGFHGFLQGKLYLLHLPLSMHNEHSLQPKTPVSDLTTSNTNLEQWVKLRLSVANKLPYYYYYYHYYYYHHRYHYYYYYYYYYYSFSSSSSCSFDLSFSSSVASKFITFSSFSSLHSVLLFLQIFLLCV